eukprot:471695-Lingulodinium_polyedra.AAC.1
MLGTGSCAGATAPPPLPAAAPIFSRWPHEICRHVARLVAAGVRAAHVGIRGATVAPSASRGRLPPQGLQCVGDLRRARVPAASGRAPAQPATDPRLGRSHVALLHRGCCEQCLCG